MTESSQTPPTSTDTRRLAHSDNALFSVKMIAALATVAAIALLFIGYRVFTVEAQRRKVNESLRLLDGRDAMVRDAREKSLELSRLRINHDNLTDEIARLNAEKERLKNDIAGQDIQIDANSKKLKLVEEENNKQRARGRQFLEKNEQLLRQFDTRKDEADRAEVAAVSAISRRNKLDSRVKELEFQSLVLETKVSKLEARRAALRDLEENQTQIKAIRGDLDKLVKSMQTSSGVVSKSAESLDATTKRLVTSVSKLQIPVQLLTESEKGISISNEQLIQASRTLKQSVNQIKENQAQIKNIGDDLGSLLAKVRARSGEFSKIVQSIQATAQNLKTTVEKDLAGSTRELRNSASEINNEVEKLSNSIKSILKAEAPVERARKQLEKDSKELEMLLGTVPGRLKTAENKLGQSVKTIALTAERLSTTERNLATEFEDLANQFSAILEQSANWSNDLNDFAERIPNAVKVYEAELNNTKRRLQRSAIQLEEAVELIIKASRSARRIAKPSEKGS